MSTSDLSSRSASAGLFAAIVASLCCITPVFALLAGVSGIAATFSWMEPFRPYLIVLTIGILGFAWYQKLKPRTKEEIECACEPARQSGGEDDLLVGKVEKPSFWQSKRFLGIITVFAWLMLAFPSYSHVFYSNGGNMSSPVFVEQDTTKTNKIVIDVKGMTCAGCENHIEHEVGLLKGVKSVDATYSTNSTTVEYYPGKVSKSEIIEAIKKTGYKVIDDNKTSSIEMSDMGNISFYKVPLVCNAAPTIGCGSRSKPVLKDFEKAESVDEEWLNRAGTVIAVVWNDPDLMTRRTLVNNVFTKHQLNASKLLMNDYAESLASFNEGTDWLLGSDVDKLSKEEAGIIAKQILKPIKEKTALNQEQEQKLTAKITDTFYDFFLNYESLEQLGDPKAYQERLKEIKVFGDNLLGKGKMPSVDELWAACSSASKSCSHSGCKSSCKIPQG